MPKNNDYSKNFNKKLQESFAFAKTTLDDWNIEQILMKMNEEFGELSENILFETGQIPHKKLSEALTGEIADCLIMTTHYTAAITKKFPTISLDYSKVSSEIGFFIKNRNNTSDYNEIYLRLDKEFTALKDPISVVDPYGFKTIEYFINSLIRLNFIYTTQNLKNSPELTADNIFSFSLNNLINTIDKKINKWKLVENKNKS